MQYHPWPVGNAKHQHIFQSGFQLRIQIHDFCPLQVVLHPAFQAQTDWDNDLALIQLKEPVVMSDKITPIPLPENGHSLHGVGFGAVAGWGWGYDMSQSHWLKHMLLPLSSRCEAVYLDNPRYDPEHMLCTGPNNFGNSVCDRDAGGALVVSDERSGDVYVAGILSYDKACRDRHYAVYTKVQPYLPWIHKVLRGDTETSAAQRSASMSKMIEWQSQ